jgi:N utilization substance protein A
MLIGYDIDVFREVAEDEEDVMLDEFNDEIDQWIIDALKQMGCDTAKSVLAIPIPELVKRAIWKKKLLPKSSAFYGQI